MKLLVDIQHGHKTGTTWTSVIAAWLPAATLKINVAELFLLYRWFRRIGTDGRLRQVVSVDTSQEALDIARQNVS